MYPKDLKILQEPHPILKKVSKPLDSLEGVEDLSQRMFNLMEEEGGIGLAAPQVGLSIRLFIIRIRRQDSEFKRVCINPEILKGEGDISIPEGCLSVANKQILVPRLAKILVQYTDIKGQKVQETLEKLEAICFQHERDHLDGILISDYEKQLLGL